MPTVPDLRIDDIALFFDGGGNVKSKCWVTHDVYTRPAQQLAEVPASWKDALFTLHPVGTGEARYYVVNLANLQPPGMPPTAGAAATAKAALAPRADLQPAAGDLVVIPHDNPDHAYLVPKADYEDPSVCPPIPEATSADLKFMALTEGVVLANLPKTDLAGMTCYLLNLLGVRPRTGGPAE